MARPLTIHGIRDKMKAAFEVADRFEPDDEVQAHLARHLCVLSAGFIEESLRIVLTTYAEARCDARCRTFIEKHLERAPNPRPGNIMELLGSFDTEWKKALEEFFSLEDGDGAIGSLIANRHLIAHGRDSQVSLRRVKDWHAVAIKMIERVEGCVSGA